MKKYILALLFASAALPALANNYFVVVPVKGKTAAPTPPSTPTTPTTPPAPPAITVELRAASLPSASTFAPYTVSLAPYLSVTGDPAFTGTGVSWSVSAGTLPAGVTLDSTTGVLSGTPSQAGTSSFSVTASYKTKSGLQAYQVLVVQSLNKVTNAGLTFVLPSKDMKDFAGANAQCSVALDGQTGWRVPTVSELGSLFAAIGNAPMAAAGWPIEAEDWYWSTTWYRTGTLRVWRPYNNTMSICGETEVCSRAICVK
jgi:hypothetical protein